jgi:hypothetical protein
MENIGMTRALNSQGTLNPYVICGNEIINLDRFSYKVVAVVGNNNTWNAYRGLTDWDDDEVARNGDAISHKAAAALFPTLDNNLSWVGY